VGAGRWVLGTGDWVLGTGAGRWVLGWGLIMTNNFGLRASDFRFKETKSDYPQ